jgi:hypothetical protein
MDWRTRWLAVGVGVLWFVLVLLLGAVLLTWLGS